MRNAGAVENAVHELVAIVAGRVHKPPRVLAVGRELQIHLVACQDPVDAPPVQSLARGRRGPKVVPAAAGDVRSVAMSRAGDEVVHHLDQAVEGVAVPVSMAQRPQDVYAEAPFELGGQDFGHGRGRPHDDASPRRHDGGQTDVSASQYYRFRTDHLDEGA